MLTLFKESSDAHHVIGGGKFFILTIHCRAFLYKDMAKTTSQKASMITDARILNISHDIPSKLDDYVFILIV